MPGTSLRAGDLAVIGYSTSMSDGTGHPALVDSISIVLLHDIAAGSTFFLTDRTWNGTVFSNSGTDGTYTYTAAGAMSAGTVITLTQADFAASGVDFDFVSGEAIYIYQGSNANTPTSFLTGLEAGDNNNVFNASLVNTGLSTAAGTAVALQYDVAAYAGPTTYAASFMYNGAGVTLQKSISDPTNWVGDDQDGVNAVEQRVQTGPWLVAADMDMWGATAGGGGGLVNISADHVFGSGIDDFNTSILYNGLLNAGTPVFWQMTDLEFDTVAGKFFLVDSDITGGHNRILQGNIADLLTNPGSLPTMTVLYSDAGVTTGSRLDNLTVDVANHIVYFTHGDNLEKVVYNSSLQTPTILFNANVTAASSVSGVGNPAGSTNNFYNDMVIDFATGHVYLSSTRVLAGASGDAVSKNFIYDLSGLTAGSSTDAFTFAAGNTGTARLLVFAENDVTYNPFPGTNIATSPFSSTQDPYAWAIERGTLDGIALDTVNHILYFSTGEILYDHDGSSGTPPVYSGGVVASYALTGNPTGLATILFQQPAQNTGAVYGIMGDLEIDTVTGRYFVTDYNGTSASNTDQHIWTGALAAPGTPTQFTSDIFNVNGLATVGMTINHAPTLTGTGLTPSVTEASSAPSSGETSKVPVFSGVTISDVDTTTADELTGAVVRISNNFESGATHQDLLRINNLTSGTIAGSGITFTYDQTSGAMVLSGAATVAEYKAAIELVTFSTSGDDVTAFGTAVTREIAASVSDGLSMSDEIFATVTVTGINDAPVNVVGGAGSATEDVASNAIAGVSVGDVDADPASQSLVVTLSVAHGTLTLGSLTGLSFSAGDGTADSTMTFAGTASAINAILGAVNGLIYTPTGNYNGADALTVTTNDQGFNGNDPGLTGTGTSEQDSDNKTINITAVNDAPTVTGGTTQATTTILEDTPLTSTQSVASLFTSHFDDSTDQQQTGGNPTGSVANTLAGIAVTANGSSGATGQWEYSTNGGGSWQSIGGVSDATARLYNAGTLIRFNPTLNYNGTEPTLTVHLIDSSGAAIVDNAVANLTGLFGGTNRTSIGTVDLGGTITAVNDAPVFAALNGTPTFTEGGAAVVLDNNATVTDVELAASGNYNGATLTLARSGGASAQDLFGATGTLVLTGAGSGNVNIGATTVGTYTQSAGTLVITFNASATQTLVNSTLDQLTYSNNSDNPPASAAIAYVFDDGNAGAQGTGGALAGNGSVTVTINPVNDAPTAIMSNHNPGPATEGVAFDLKATAGLSVADIDGNSGSETVTLAVGQGVLNVTAGTSGAVVAGTGTGAVTITGTIAQINALLSSDATSTVSYLNSSDTPAATSSLTLTIHDNGNTGGGDLSAVDSGTIAITAVNDAPINNVPVATQVLAEDATRAFNAGNTNLITVGDVDVGAGTLTVTIAVDHGALTLSGIGGLAFGAGDGTGDATMTFTGTAAAINAALNGLVYAPTADYNGPDTLTLTTNDNGNTGTPGAQQDMDTVAISVTAVNDAPVRIGTGTETMTAIGEDQANPGQTVSSIASPIFTDPADSPANGLAGMAVYINGSNAAGQWEYSTNGGGSWTSIGAVALNNAMLLGGATLIRFHPTADFNGAAPQLAFLLVDDSGGALTDGNHVDLSGAGAIGGTSRYSGDGTFLDQAINAVADIADDSVSVVMNSGSNNLNLLANDMFENAGRAITAVGAAAHGTTTVSNAGTPLDATDDFVTYTPTAGYTGPDSFTYTVTSGGVMETANVTVAVTSPNSPPVVDLNTGTAGIDDTNIYSENSSGSGIGTTIGVSDADAGDMIHGATVALSDPETGDQIFVNLPLPGGITVDGASTDDILILTGTASAADYATALGQVGYHSTSDDPTIGGTHTSRSIGVTVSDGTANSAPATMTMTIFASDDPAVAKNDAVATNEATALAGNVFANNGSGADSDVDGPALSVSAVNGNAGVVGTQITLASGAHLTLNANGTFNYDPNHAFDATPAANSGASNMPAHDSFTYTLTNGGTATVSLTIAGLDSDDSLFGTGGNDSLFGGVGRDIIGGLGGDDILSGGAGVANVMIGGMGNDTYIVQVAGDTLVEQAGEGTDRVLTALASYSILNRPNIENLTGLAATGQSLTGNDGDNVIISDGGNDQLFGGLGHDVLASFGGNDVLSGGTGAANEMVGGTGNDTYIVQAVGDTLVELAGEGTDTVQTTLSSFTLLDNFENLFFIGSGDFSGTGNTAANTIVGGAGNDHLAGGAGAANQLVGGAGNDTYVVTVAGDSIIELAGGGTDTVETALASYQLGAANVENLTGTSGAGQILAGSAGDNAITGAGGNDLLNGGLGADTLAGNGGADYFLFDSALGGGNVDTITDFTSGSDRILLDNAVFSALSEGGLPPTAFVIGTAALDADDRIIYDSATGNLFYDADGNGAGAAVQFATLSGHPILTANDFGVI
jgi:Ca2+-binding RTX toxin-like protein